MHAVRRRPGAGGAVRVRRARPLRRGAVALGVIAWIASTTTALVIEDARSSWPWWTAFVILMAAWVGARYLTGDITEGGADRLDERELELKYRLSYTGFICVSVAGAVMAVYLVVAERNPELMMRAATLLVTLIAGAASTPTMILCWTLEDQDDD